MESIVFLKPEEQGLNLQLIKYVIQGVLEFSETQFPHL